MSTDQATLTESIERIDNSPTGAMYSRGGGVSNPDADTEKIPRCHGCERPLREILGSRREARQVARVVGDNEGHVPGCPECVRVRDAGSRPTSVASAANIAREQQRGKK